MLSRNIETFLECDKTYEEADTVLFGAPFDSTTSFRPGTRFGSGAIRHESFGLESYSPYQDRDLRDARIMTVEIWSFLLETRRKYSGRSKSGQQRFWKPEKDPSFWEESTWSR